MTTTESSGPDDIVAIDLDGDRSAIISRPRSGVDLTLRIGKRVVGRTHDGERMRILCPPLPTTVADGPDTREGGDPPSYRLVGDPITIPSEAVESLAAALRFLAARPVVTRR